MLPIAHRPADLAHTHMPLPMTFRIGIISHPWPPLTRSDLHTDLRRERRIVVGRITVCIIPRMRLKRRRVRLSLLRIVLLVCVVCTGVTAW